LRVPLPSNHPGLDPDHPVLLFDGVCGLCERSVGFVARHDRKGAIRFAPLQSAVAQRLLLAAEAPAPLPDSMVVVDGGRCYVASDAVLRLTQRLPYPWRLLSVAGLLPRRWREGAYRFVAHNRYRWFGTRETCMAPAPGLAERFLA